MVGGRQRKSIIMRLTVHPHDTQGVFSQDLFFDPGLEAPFVESLHAFDQRAAGVGGSEQKAVGKKRVGGFNVFVGPGHVGADHV